MTIRVLVNGAAGRMGTAAVKTFLAHPEFDLVGQTGRHDNLSATIKKNNAQVVVDLTNADAVFENAQTIISAGAHPVIGTSGLVSEQIEILKNQCAERELGGLIVPNFSLGAILMMKYSQEIAKYFSHVEIIEMHHDGKLDSPSGTALRTAEMLALYKADVPQKTTRDTIPGARGAIHHNIPIHSIRLPGLIAHQQIMFGGVGETLTIRHDSIDRESFMPGIRLACEKVISLNKLMYGLENVL